MQPDREKPLGISAFCFPRIETTRLRNDYAEWVVVPGQKIAMGHVCLCFHLERSRREIFAGCCLSGNYSSALGSEDHSVVVATQSDNCLSEAEKDDVLMELFCRDILKETLVRICNVEFLPPIVFLIGSHCASQGTDCRARQMPA